MDHAIRYHLRERWDEDPQHYARLSERLEEIIEELGEQWEQLALALGDLLPDVRAGRQADDSGLDPVTEAPFYDLLLRELASEGKTLSSPAEGLLRATRLAEPMIDGEDLFDFGRIDPVADRLVELAKANHARLAAS